MWKKLVKSIRKILGLKYILNISTGEVHLCDSCNCGVDRMASHNKKYLTKKQYLKIVHTYYNRKWVNGCARCNKLTNKE